MPDPPRRKKGRPPLDPNDPSVKVSFRLPGKKYDDLYRRARDARMEMGAFIRARLQVSPTREQ